MTQAPVSIPERPTAPAVLRPTVGTTAEEAVRESADRSGVALRHRRYRRLLAVGDVAGFALALVLAVWIVGEANLSWPAFVLPLLVPFAAKIFGLYDHDELVLSKRSLDDAPKLFSIAVMFVFALWFGSDVLLDDRLGRPQALTVLAAAAVIPLLTRRAAREAAKAVTVPERCIFIGPADAAAQLRDKLEHKGHATLVEHLTVGDVLARGHDGAWAMPSTMRELVERTDAHRVIVATGGTDEGVEAAYDIVRSAKQLGVRVSILPGQFGIVATAVGIDELAGMVLLGVRPLGMSRSSTLLKRWFDVVGASLGLLVTAPLLTLAAVAIRLDSPGPLLFHQRRVGRGGREFGMLKLRTMVDGADELKPELVTRNEADGLFKIAADPRVTRVGRLLRRTAIDELPQLWNVLRGEMSLVGPRPLILEEDDKITGWDRRRLLLTPGMTGPWQIAGSARVPLADMVKIDYRYISSWSLWQDIKILLRTVVYAVGARGQ